MRRIVDLALFVVLTSVFLFSCARGPKVSLHADEEKQWYKGNTHTHTLWSDGDGAPEVSAAWYKENGYQFLCLSDHNILNSSTRPFYYPITEDGKLTPARVAVLKAEYGDDWVVEKDIDGRPHMQLKSLPELKQRFEMPGEYLLVPSEEITAKRAHVNALNLQKRIAPYERGTAVDAIRDAFIKIEAQSKEYGVPMMGHLNHPNWSTGVTAEEMVMVPEERFFEVYNGGPGVHNHGNPEKHMPTTDRLWDIALTLRLNHNKDDILYGLATDDTHNYHTIAPDMSNAGRGFIYVLSNELSCNALVEAINRGDFYASTGVELEAIQVSKKHYSVSIKEEPGVTYTTQFIGTPKKADLTRGPILADNGKEIRRATGTYSEEIGQVLLETTENPAVYPFTGDELYVRVRVVSSKDKANTEIIAHEKERAWTQPVLP